LFFLDKRAKKCSKNVARRGEIPKGFDDSAQYWPVHPETIPAIQTGIVRFIPKGWPSSTPGLPGHPERMAIIQPSVGRRHRPTLGKHRPR